MSRILCLHLNPMYVNSDGVPSFTWLQLTTQAKKIHHQELYFYSLSQVKKQVRATWGDRAVAFDDKVLDDLDITTIDSVDDEADRVHFYRMTRVTMIAKIIEGLFNEASIKTLFNKKREFTWNDSLTGIKDLDGPTMLQIIIQCINPTTRIGVSD